MCNFPMSARYSRRRRLAALGILVCALFAARALAAVDGGSWQNELGGGLNEPQNSSASDSGIVWGDGSTRNITNVALHAAIDVDPLTPRAQAAELSDGQTLRVEGVLADLKIDIPTRVPFELRAGVFYSRGKPDGAGWLGYFFGNSSSGGPAELYSRNPRNDSLFISVDGARSLTNQVRRPTGLPDLSSGSYSFFIELARIGGAMRYSAKMVRLGDGVVFADFSGLDTRPTTFVFDKIGFLAGRNLGASQVRLSDLRVSVIRMKETAPVVESTAALPPGLVQISPDGAWTWFNDERALWHQGELYAGYVTSAGDVGLSRYDPKERTATSYVLGSARARQIDDHNNPSLMSRADGRLLAVYSKHGAAKEFYSRISLLSNPVSASEWDVEQVVPVPAGNTYANVFQLSAEGDKVYSFHRCLNWNPTLSTSTDGGASWQPATHFITAGISRSVRPYMRLVSNNTDRIDVLYTDGHPRDVENSVYHLYYKKGAFCRSDGSQIKTLESLPLDHAAGERGSLVYAYKPELGRGWVWDVHYDKNDNPVCAFQTRRSDVTGTGWEHGRIYYYYATWTGTEWRSTFIAHGGRALYEKENDYGAGMAIDPDDTRVVYVATNAARPFDLGDRDDVPLNKNERYELWRGFTADGGLSFDWQPVTRDSSEDNIRPAVPANHGAGPGVLWVRGRYTTYTDYRTRIVALLEASGLPKGGNK